MVINQIGGIDPLKNVQNTHKTANKMPVSLGEDTVSVSDEARELAEAYYLKEIADETPDVRSDVIARIKNKIQDPGYINAAVIDSVADRFLDSLGI
ncbi:MAG: flagellar biosynthesis anti-sigma factor FlgM [Bacteroides sp.]|nr:flagellar biosynthesis anti-sigma factor FlgM [Prevotella sp.]MCM1408410.1 flagellar biosynthesis anti-sigma factor FlgM [Treponema brennaborense]MCM1469428.1 flagellar biosynthesis anti-sigma factor FlgM [Bacteroides sp.]